MADPTVPDRAGMRALAAALGDRANELAAAGRAAEVPGLWEDAIAGLDGPDGSDGGEPRARITLAYAWYLVLHGDVEHGVQVAAGLRESPVAPVRGQVRALIRSRWQVAPEAVERAWHAATEAALPDWAFLTEEQIDAVADWVSAPTWQESQARYDARISALGPQEIDAVLEELALGGDSGLRAAVAVHRAVLVLGGEAGYRSLADPAQAARAAGAAIRRRDWRALRACGTVELFVHRRRLLGAVHVAVAEAMSDGGTAILVTPVLAERLATLAEDATAGEREQAVEDLRAVGDEAVAGLLAALD